MGWFIHSLPNITIAYKMCCGEQLSCLQYHFHDMFVAMVVSSNSWTLVQHKYVHDQFFLSSSTVTFFKPSPFNMSFNCDLNVCSCFANKSNPNSLRQPPVFRFSSSGRLITTQTTLLPSARLTMLRRSDRLMFVASTIVGNPLSMRVLSLRLRLVFLPSLLVDRMHLKDYLSSQFRWLIV